MRKPISSKDVVFSLFSFIILITLSLPLSAQGAAKSFRNSLEMEFSFIAAGSFSMGSPPAEAFRHKCEALHRVTISRPYYMQTTEVTLKQWWEIMGKKLFGRRKGPENLPVVKVSWFDCQKFIKKLNARGEGYYRLPTETEWEYACRAGSDTAYSWGNSIDCAKAMYSNNSKKASECQAFIKKKGIEVDRPAAVKSYAPNAWGLYDMHGNVWEWCLDWYGPYPHTAPTDPCGPKSGPGKIRRGGSWFKHGHALRSANRAYAHPASRFQTTGLRLVWSKTPMEMEAPSGVRPRLSIDEPDGP